MKLSPVTCIGSGTTNFVRGLLRSSPHNVAMMCRKDAKGGRKTTKIFVVRLDRYHDITMPISTVTQNKRQTARSCPRSGILQIPDEIFGILLPSHTVHLHPLAAL